MQPRLLQQHQLHQVLRPTPGTRVANYDSGSQQRLNINYYIKYSDLQVVNFDSGSQQRLHTNYKKEITIHKR